MLPDTSTRPLPAVTHVETMPNFQLRLEFDNGEIRVFDMGPFLSRASGVFEPLREMANFRRAFVAQGTVCWPSDVDLDPELLYQQSEQIGQKIDSE